MKGTIFDFLKLAAEKPEVARELAELAAKHGIEFSDELSDKELEAVAGGVNIADLEGQMTTQGEMTEMSQMDLQVQQEELTRAVQTYSNILKQWQDTSNTIVNNIKG